MSCLHIVFSACARASRLALLGLLIAPLQVIAAVPGSCFGYANYADELRVSAFQLVGQTDLGDGTSEVQLSFQTENIDQAEFNTAQVLLDADALQDLAVVRESIVPASLGSVLPHATVAAPTANLTLRLPTTNVSELLTRLNAGLVPVTVHAEEANQMDPSIISVSWGGTEESYYVLARDIGGANPEPHPAPYGLDEQFSFTLLAQSENASSVFDQWAPGVTMYVNEDPAQPLTQIPQVYRNVRVVDVDKDPGDAQNPRTLWTVTVQRPLRDNLASLFTSASFCSGSNAHVDRPVHDSRLQEIDGAPQPEEERDRRPQPIRFNDVEVDTNLKVSGQVEGHILKPSVEMRFRGGRPKVVATFDTDLTLSAEARAGASVDAAGEASLYRLCFPVASFPAGPINIDLSLQLEHFVGYTGNMEAEAVVGVQKRFHHQYSIGYDDRLPAGDKYFSDAKDLSPPMDFTPPQLTDKTAAHGQIYTRIRPTLRLGTPYPDCSTGTGAWVEVKAYGTVDVTPTQDPWWTLGAGADLYGGLDLQLLGLDIASWQSQPVTLASTETRAAPGAAPLAQAKVAKVQAASAGTTRQSGEDQRWAMGIDDLDRGTSINHATVAATADNGALVAANDLYSRLVRLDDHGAFLWAKEYFYAYKARRILPLPGGEFLVAGQPNWLARHDAVGNVLWSRDYKLAPPGSSNFVRCEVNDAALLETAPGQYDTILVGKTTVESPTRACVQRVAANGDLVWARSYDSVNHQEFHGAHVTRDGRIAVVGRWDGLTPTSIGDQVKTAGIIAKLDAATGDVVWAKRMSNTLYRNSTFYAVTEGADGTLFAVGNMGGIVTQRGGASLARIASDGTDPRHALLMHDQDWEQLLNFEPYTLQDIGYFDIYDTLYAIAPMADGFAVAGRSRLATAERGEAAWLAKINTHLGVEWFSTLDGDVNDSFYALTYTPDGLLVAGRSNSLTGVGQAVNDHWIVVGKYPVNGRIVLKPEVNVTARHMEPGVRDSGNDLSVSNPGVVMDAEVSVQDLEVRAVAAIGNLYVSTAPQLCVTKLTDTGRVSTLDACVVDADGDGVDDAVDNCPSHANADQADADGDGVGDACDNCRTVSNADQRDTNGDGYGNLCDADLDNNGVVNTRDLALFKTAFGQSGANLDADLNGNGSVNTQDLAIFKALFGKPPGPSGIAP